MKLYYSNTSPYSRKVRLVLHEKSMFDDVEHILINPFEDINELKDINPLGKIPVLIKDDGKAMYDSPVICHYLDSFGDRKLIPKDKIWDVLQWEALADGIMDASFQTVIELKRPEQEQSKKWIKHWADDIDRGLLVMQDELESLGDTTHLAHLSFATAMSYLELRLPQFIQNKSDIIILMKWYQEFRKQDCMLATELG